jgi:hypothetical protein
MSHGIYNTRFLYGMDEAQERLLCRQRGSLERHTAAPQGILTPAINTTRTPARSPRPELPRRLVHDDAGAHPGGGTWCRCRTRTT